MNENRRSFIKKSALAGAALTMTSPWARTQGANGDIRVAVVGIRGRGRNHIDGFANAKGARVVALCDVDKQVLAERKSQYEAKYKNKLDTYVDYRELVQRDDIDLISIATPNHTHAIISIAAMQAGKDVYVEKPVSHNVWEGRQIVNAARKYNRICQTGTQSRSNPGMRDTVDFIQSGELGRIKLVRGLCYKRRPSIGNVEGPQKVPDHIDYDLWTGPAPMKPLMRKNLHYDWHWVQDTGNGDLGNQGIHQVDISRWILGEDQLASGVVSLGGRVGYVDDGDTANTQLIFFDYDTAPFVFEVRGLGRWPEQNERPKYRGVDVGVIVDCEKGYVVIPSYNRSRVHAPDGKVIREFSGSGDHYQNCLKAVHSRKHTDLHADILEGHLSSSLCHIGNISYYLGEQASPFQIMEHIEKDPIKTESFGRMMEHITTNLVDLDKTPLSFGQSLKFDPKKEKIQPTRRKSSSEVGKVHDAANKHFSIGISSAKAADLTSLRARDNLDFSNK